MDLEEIYEGARKTVIGQDEALREFITVLGRNYSSANKQNIILKGDRGSGKTSISREVAYQIGLPFIQVDISTVSEGLPGGSYIYEALSIIYHQLNEEGLAGIISINNFDKAMQTFDMTDVLNIVRKDAIPIIDSSINMTGYYDLSQVTFVAEGEFPERVIGYTGKKSQLDDLELKTSFTKLIETKPVTEELIRRTLRESGTSPFKGLGHIRASKEEKNKIVGMVMEKGVGLHSLPSVTDEVLYPKLVKKLF